MVREIASKDLKTLAIVIRRVNYGEADRILTLITPEGKISAIAKGVRRPKSKLAGGVEMFSLTELNLHEGKGELYTVTNAKMKKYYGNILKDFGKTELAGAILKRINKGDGFSEYFSIAWQCLEELNEDTDTELVRVWFLLNVTNLTEEINLYRDEQGEKLEVNTKYNWNLSEKAFSKNEYGVFSADEIKMLRLMISLELKMIKKIKVQPEIMTKVLDFAKVIV